MFKSNIKEVIIVFWFNVGCNLFANLLWDKLLC